MWPEDLLWGGAACPCPLPGLLGTLTRWRGREKQPVPHEEGREKQPVPHEEGPRTRWSLSLGHTPTRGACP